MAVVLRREPSLFWRKARLEARRRHAPVPPSLPFGAVVQIPERGEVFVRYAPGPPGAPTVLLLHGWMASADLNWLGSFSALSDRYHVLAMDHRGHGRGIRTTDPFTLEDCADDAAGLLHELGVRDAIVVGYSMGGPISLLLARRHPEDVRGLVLVATAADLGRSGGERGMAIGVRLLGPLFRSGLPDRILREIANRQPAALGELAQLAPWMAGEMKRLNPGDIVDAGRAIAAFDGRPWLDELAMPAVSVVTLLDRAVRPERQQATADALGAQVIELHGGHTVCTSDPHLLGAAVREAADRILEGAPHGRWLARATERLLRARSLPEDVAIEPVPPVLV